MIVNDAWSDSDYVNALIYILTLLYVLFHNNEVYVIYSCVAALDQISNGFARQNAILSKRIMADRPNLPSISLRFLRRKFGRMHTRQPSRTSNKRARSGDVEGQQRKGSVWFWTKTFILLRAAKWEMLSEANTIRETGYWLLIVSVNCYLLLIVVNR